MAESTLTLPQRLQSAAMRAFAKVPQPALSWLAGRLGGPPVNRDDERLDPDIWLGLLAHERIAAQREQELDERAEIARARDALDVDALIFSEPPDSRVVEFELGFDGPGGPISVTRYKPPVSNGIMVFFHGGGWVVGSRASHAGLCRFLALNADVDVVSVDYRLAPEHKFPAAVEDALAAWQWAVSELMPDARLRVVAGDSAGGNLAAVVAQQMRGRDGLEPDLQLLIYPGLDLAFERDSVHEFAVGFQLTHAQILWYKRHYVRSEDDYEDVRASPLLSEDLSGLAPAYIAVAGFDPLRDEGIAYAQRLRAAGVAVDLYRAGGLIHGFANLTAVSPGARRAMLDACRALQRTAGTVRRP
jgi:acetyl esterase